MGYKNAGVVPQEVKGFLRQRTSMINIVIVLCQIFYTFVFWSVDADLMFYYMLCTFVSFFFSVYMFKHGKVKFYIYSVFISIFIMMILAVICLGWEFGFQQYCIGFVASLLFTGFITNKDRKVTKTTIGLVFGNVLLYLGLRLWTYRHPYIYEIEYDWVAGVFYIYNSIVGFSFLLMYLLIYASTVRRLENSLREMANIDPLTGICNRRKMQQILKNALEQPEDVPYQAAVAMLDVDYFKKVNDTYGHDAGDEVLLTLAHMLFEKQEQNDGFHVCRWGGEEFLVFYEKYRCDRSSIVKEFDELRKKIEETVIAVGNKEIKITVTIGLAFYEEGETIQELTKIADECLYDGKRSGRNRVLSNIE